MLAAACSGGSDDDSGATTTSIATAPSSTSTVPRFTGDPTSPFCELLRDLDVDAALESDPDDPAAVEAAFAAVLSALEETRAAAPADIAGDVALVAEGMAALDAALAAAGYDFEALAASGAADDLRILIDDPAFEAAGVRVGAYRNQVCQL
ncbi:MAG: hypothetical protein ACSLFP_15870 [Acidimicrobiales bacterium]